MGWNEDVKDRKIQRVRDIKDRHIKDYNDQDRDTER